ncbi:MAG: hypothetical protein PPFGHCPK_00158 [Spiroplasma endosymbiont of Drosophila atripex]|nr:MAG: hypothetical protein PPFGHCPK_00158 [Spiroplasma endosymbiont of Drosophila atripex]
MAIDELSFKPTLEINKNKDIEALKSIITEINKVGRNSTINIIQNKDISDEKKYLALWEENMKLNSIINNEIQPRVIKLENQLNFNEYRMSFYKRESNLRFEFLLSGFIIDFTRKNYKDSESSVNYIVNKKDYEIFLRCVAAFEEHITIDDLIDYVSKNYQNKVKMEVLKELQE